MNVDIFQWERNRKIHPRSENDNTKLCSLEATHCSSLYSKCIEIQQFDVNFVWPF